MTTPLHPDGRPITDTPDCDEAMKIAKKVSYVAYVQERQKRKAEAQLAVAMKFLNRVESMKDRVVQWGIVTNVLAQIKAIEEAK